MITKMQKHSSQTNIRTNSGNRAAHSGAVHNTAPQSRGGSAKSKPQQARYASGQNSGANSNNQSLHDVRTSA